MRLNKLTFTHIYSPSPHHFIFTLWTHCSFSFTFSYNESHQPNAPISVVSAIRTVTKMDIPRKYLFSPILALILLSFIVVEVLRPVHLLNFTTIAGSKRGHSVPLDRLRTKLSGQNQLHAVLNSDELRRNKFSDRTATVSSLLFCLFRLSSFLCFGELISRRFETADVASLIIGIN